MKKKMVISVSEKTFPCPGFAIGIFKEATRKFGTRLNRSHKESEKVE